ncbi:hypothetical protein [Streptomyces sparsus]
MVKQSKLRLRVVGGIVAAVATAGLVSPAAAQAAPSADSGTHAAASDVRAMATWRTISTHRTSFTCAGQKAAVELSTNWVLRCQKAGTFTYHLQRYS